MSLFSKELKAHVMVYRKSRHTMIPFSDYMGFLVTQTVKNPPAIQETQVWSLGQEDPLEKGITTHSSILAWRIPWTEEPGGLQSMRLQRVRHSWVINTFTFNEYIWKKHFLDPLEEEMAAHSSILAWRIPLTEEPGGLPIVIELQKVRHDWSYLARMLE